MRKRFSNKKPCPLQNQIVAIYLGTSKILALLQAPELLGTVFYFKWHVVNQTFGCDKDLHLEQGRMVFQLALGGLVPLLWRCMKGSQTWRKILPLV